MPLHVSSTCAHHQEVKIALHSFWYLHTYRWSSLLSQPVHETATYRCDDTRGCVMQFWPPGDEHMCSKHVEAWNKFIVKQKFCAWSWLITEINILRCTVSKTSKFDPIYSYLRCLLSVKIKKYCQCVNHKRMWGRRSTDLHILDRCNLWKLVLRPSPFNPKERTVITNWKM